MNFQALGNLMDKSLYQIFSLRQQQSFVTQSQDNYCFSVGFLFLSGVVAPAVGLSIFLLTGGDEGGWRGGTRECVNK